MAVCKPLTEAVYCSFLQLYHALYLTNSCTCKMIFGPMDVKAGSLENNFLSQPLKTLSC